MRELATDIQAYVMIGGRDALSFSLLSKPYHGDIPGKILQRMIDAEVEQIKRQEAK